MVHEDLLVLREHKLSSLLSFNPIWSLRLKQYLQVSDGLNDLKKKYLITFTLIAGYWRHINNKTTIFFIELFPELESRLAPGVAHPLPLTSTQRSGESAPGCANKGYVLSG